MPKNTVKVDRTSDFGNPFRVGPDGNAAECVEKYRAMIDGNIFSFPTKDDIKNELRGKHLGCWCKIGAPCHGTVLLEIANA